MEKQFQERVAAIESNESFRRLRLERMALIQGVFAEFVKQGHSEAIAAQLTIAYMQPDDAE